MHRSLRTLRLFAAANAHALAGYVCLRHRQIRTQQEQPFGHFTSQQITDRTVPLCRALQTEANNLLVTAEQDLTHGLHGRRWRLWQVDCTGPAGEPVAEFTWDADTGELVRVGHWMGEVSTREPAAAPPTHLLTRQQTQARAATLAYRWLQLLGFAQEGSRWHLSRAPEPSTPQWCHVWTTRWRSGECAVLVKVHVVSGDLVYAQRYHPSALLPVR
jgi:hypothetical protein